MYEGRPATRRAVLQGGSTALLVGLAACTGGETVSTESDAPGSRESDATTLTPTPTGERAANGAPQEGQLSTQYTNWLGPEMAREGVVDAIEASCPARATALQRLDDSTRQLLASKRIYVPRIDVEAEFAPEDIDLVLQNARNQFGVMVGQFDRSMVESHFEEWTEPAGTYRNHTLYVGSRPRTETDGREWMGWAVSGRAILFERRPTKRKTLTATRALLDTGAGEAPSFVDTHQATNTAVSLLGDGVSHSIGPYGQRHISGIRMRIDGETAYRRSIYHASSDLTETAEYIRDRVNRAKQPRSETDLPRTTRDLFAPYESVSVETHGDFVVVDGHVPTEIVTQCDLFCMVA